METEDNIVNFYNYQGPSTSFSKTGLIPTISQTLQITIHGSSFGCELSVLPLHDKCNDGSGGRIFMTFDGDFSNPTVKDDPEQNTLADHYHYNPATDTTTVRWTWDVCCSDGLAQTVNLTSVGDCVRNVDPPIFENGMNRWVYIARPLALNTSVTSSDLIDLDTAARLEICRVNS